MPEIIFESDKGIVFEKTTYKNGRCKVAVKHKESGTVNMTYRFKNVPGLDSPFISWENLNYCAGGWHSDYLLTAVQYGKKLYAGITFSYTDEAGKRLITDKISDIKNELPNGCDIGSEEPHETHNGPHTFPHFYICKTGTISDYLNMDDVFAAYDRLGVRIETETTKTILELCGVPLPHFAKLTAPFEYANASTGAELIVTGLLLGYPLESTASLIDTHGLLYVKK